MAFNPPPPRHPTSIATQAQLTQEELMLLTKVQTVSKHKRSPIQVLTKANVAELVGSGYHRICHAKSPLTLQHFTRVITFHMLLINEI